MPPYMYGLFGAATVLLLVIQTIASNRERKKRLRQRICDSFGCIPDCEYTSDEMKRISHGFRKKEKNGYYVDDITWNDLDMDAVFMRLNHTWSSAGEEYLYQALRFPLSSKEELERRGRLIAYFQEQEKERNQVTETIAQIGYTRKYALSEYFDNFLGLEKQSFLYQYTHLLLFAVGVAVSFIENSIGVAILVITLVCSIVNYFQKKAKIEPYFICLSYLIRLAVCCEDLGKRKSGNRELDELYQAAGVCGKKLAYLRKRIWLVGTGNKVSGGLEDILLDYIRMIFHVDVITFYRMLAAVQKHESELNEMRQLVGELELAMAAASTRELYEPTCVPVFDKKTSGIQAVDLYHPLLSQPVANSIDTNRPVLLTGSNASGKSTFLKTLALNQILAQTIDTVFAREFHGSFAKVYTSMSLRDSLERQESYYIAEIKSLKRILEASAQYDDIYCFVDEVLRGTNTVERIAASSQILSSMEKKGVLTFAATHDIELTYLLEKQYANYHFEEQIAENQVMFDYKLKDGRAVTRNAILLLSMMGYGEDIIEKAQVSAENFLKEGLWKAAE